MKTISKLGTLVVAVIVAGLLSGCETRITDFTLLSTKNIDLANASSLKRVSTRVRGEDSALFILFIPTGFPQVKDAVDKALEGTPGAVALVDGVVKNRGWWFIFGQVGFVVEGTPLIDPTLTGQVLPTTTTVTPANPNRVSAGSVTATTTSIAAPTTPAATPITVPPPANTAPQSPPAASPATTYSTPNSTYTEVTTNTPAKP